MRDNRAWIIPATIILLVITAWAFRWGDGGKQGNKTYSIDRWLGQTWVKEVNENGYSDYPFISPEILAEKTYLLIKKDPDLSSQDNYLTQEVARYKKVAKDNAIHADEYQYLVEYHNKEWLRINRPDLPNWAINTGLSTGDAQQTKYGSDRIPLYIVEGDKAYWDSLSKTDGLNIQSASLFASTSKQVTAELTNKADTKRQMASFGSVAIGLVALGWLIYLFVFVNKNPIESDKTDFPEETA